MILSEIRIALLILTDRFQIFDRFGAYIFIVEGSLKMGATYFSETVVSTHQIPRRHIKTICRKMQLFE